MTIIKKIPLFHLLLTGLLLWYADASAQSIDHLVRIHSAKNTEMRPLDVERVDDHIYTVYENIHRDTVKIDGQPLGLDTLPREQMPIVISQFDTSHQLLRTSVLTASRPFRGAIAFQNVRYHGDRIYLFVSIYDKELRYNGETIWAATPVDDILNINRWFVMVTLDSDLNLVRVKGIDHWYSGYEDIAFGDDRMYLFGRVSHIDNTPDTVSVDGYDIVTMTEGKRVSTSFMMTYDLETDSLLHCVRMGIGLAVSYFHHGNVRIGSDGTVYQLILTGCDSITMEDGNVLGFVWPEYYSFVFKYSKDGLLEDWIRFSPQGGITNFSKMEMTSDGDLVFYGRVAYRITLNDEDLVKLPLDHGAVVMSMNPTTLGVNWYDYISVRSFGSGVSIHADDLDIDNDDNVYTISSFRVDVRGSQNINGETIKFGTYITKYDREGKMKNRVRWANTVEDPDVLITSGHDGKLVVFRTKEGKKNEMDSIINENIAYSSQMNLFKFTFDDVSSGIDDEWTKTSPFAIYPNPVHKDGILKVLGQSDIDNLLYIILDAFGRVVARGNFHQSEGIALAALKLQSGLYYLSLGVMGTGLQKFVVIE
ncbi:MAG: T9SS type A sorting domain-containing protein [Lewinellaceae bacterium]|nr:T9SS type A sorting domain-containing protein [Lewinellaceae bacterium]